MSPVADSGKALNGVFVRLLTSHGAVGLKPHMCIEKCDIRHAPDLKVLKPGHSVFALGRIWLWSPIQKVFYVE